MDVHITFYYAPKQMSINFTSLCLIVAFIGAVFFTRLIFRLNLKERRKSGIENYLVLISLQLIFNLNKIKS